MTILLAVSCEGSAKKVVNVTHEVNLDVFREIGAEEFLLSRVGGVKYEVINVEGFMSERRVSIIDDTRVETMIVQRWLQFHLFKNEGEDIVPVMI